MPPCILDGIVTSMSAVFHFFIKLTFFVVRVTGCTLLDVSGNTMRWSRCHHIHVSFKKLKWISEVEHSNLHPQDVAALVPTPVFLFLDIVGRDWCRYVVCSIGFPNLPRDFVHVMFTV